MKIKKLLVVPCFKLIQDDKVPKSFLERAIASVGGILKSKALINNQEILAYADVPKILGSEHVFFLGQLRPPLCDPAVPSRSVYPSFHGATRGTEIPMSDLPAVLKEVNAVLISILAGTHRDEIIRQARRHGLPIIIIDYVEHESNYGATDRGKELSRGLVRGKDFDLYFKLDLPLGYQTEAIRPLAPVPVRPQSYQFTSGVKDIDIFFSGRHRPVYQGDREETTTLVKSHFPGAMVLEHRGFQGYQSPIKYWVRVARSKMALCPSGRTWATQRQTETALVPGTVLITPRPYIETTGPALQENTNAVLYDVEFREGKYHLANPNGLREQITYYLSRPSELKRLSEAWTNDVLCGHTIMARTQYMLDSIERVL